jgi:cell fate regulator YaaT (PSP1 superfamily)
MMYNERENIDFSDIPEITDFSKARRNPFAGQFKDGYTVIVEHKDYDEIITVKKTRREKNSTNDNPAPKEA